MAMARAPGRALTVPKVVRTPEVPSMLYIVTSLESSPDTYKNFPEGSTVSHAGSIPAAKGEPATSLRAPVVEFRVQAETWLESPFATTANLPAGSRAKWHGPAPAGKGDTDIG